MRPPSFDADHICYWDEWVLVHGLPDLPPVVGVGEAVPVAWWRGGGWAAVLNLEYVADDAEFDEPARLDTDTQSFRWDGRAWEMADGSGGAGWFPGFDVRPPAHLGPREAFAMHCGSHASHEWASGVLDGVAGVEAESVEVEQGGRRHRQALDSPVGAWVAAFDGRRPATVRVLGRGSILFEREVPPLAF